MGRYNGKTCRLLCMIAMTTTFFFVEIITGFIVNSLALVGDSYHMLSDIVALCVGFASVRVRLLFYWCDGGWGGEGEGGQRLWYNGSMLDCWSTGRVINLHQGHDSMIHNNIHLISSGCPQPCMALQCRIVA